MRLRWTAIVLTALFVASCAPNDPNPAASGPSLLSPAPGVTIHPAPEGTADDPLRGLPETDSKARLLVSITDAARPLMVIDLSAGRTIDISGIPGGGLQLGAFTPGGGVVFVAGPRTIGFLDATGARRTSPIELPATVAGAIISLGVIDDALLVSTRVSEQGRERDGRSVVLELDGKLRCEGPEETVYSWFRAGAVWSADLRAKLDVGTCTPSAGLDLQGFEGPLFFVVAGSSGYLSVNGNSLSRFDLGTGASVATSREWSEPISDVVIRDDELWVLAGGELSRLDLTSLEGKSSTRLLECAYHPSFVESGDALYLVDDCQAALYRLSSAPSLVEGWRLPLEEGSDIQVHGLPPERASGSSTRNKAVSRTSSISPVIGSNKSRSG